MSWIDAPLFLALASLAAAQEPNESANAFVTTRLARTSWFVNEPIRVQLVLGFETGFLEKNLIQLFRTRLDVPAQLEAPWLRELAGTVALADEPRERAGVRDPLHPSLVLGDERIEATRVEQRAIDGRTFTVLEIERFFLPTRAGELELPEPVLRFAYATKFDAVLIDDRVPADRHDVVLRGARQAWQIRALPEQGRPAGFGGAVGRFGIRAQAVPDELRPGESFQLVLRIEGEGNFESFDAPRLGELAGLRVFGSKDEKSRTRRTITWELAALDSHTREVPSIPFVYFDTGSPPAYRTLHTESVPLFVSVSESEAAEAPIPIYLFLAGILIVQLLVFGVLARRAWLRKRARRSSEGPTEPT